MWVLTHSSQRFGVTSYLVKVVDRFSSVIGNPNEIVSDIQADHRNMTKFSQSDEPGFLSICNALDRWMKELSNARSGCEWPYVLTVFFLPGCYNREGPEILKADFKMLTDDAAILRHGMHPKLFFRKL